MKRFVVLAAVFLAVSVSLTGVVNADGGCTGAIPYSVPCPDAGAVSACPPGPADGQPSPQLCSSRYRYSPQSVALSCVPAGPSDQCSPAFIVDGQFGVLPKTTVCGTRTYCYYGLSPIWSPPQYTCLTGTTTYDTKTTYYDSSCTSPGGGGPNQ